MTTEQLLTLLYEEERKEMKQSPSIIQTLIIILIVQIITTILHNIGLKNCKISLEFISCYTLFKYLRLLTIAEI